MTRFIKVCLTISARRNRSNPATSVIHALYFSIVSCICFRSSHPAIYRFSLCSTSIPPQTNLASPFRTTRDLWYTSTHAERYTVSLASGPDEAGDSILNNTDGRFRLSLR